MDIKEIQKNRITVGSKHYYMINDFAAAIGKKPNAIYQMIHRGTIHQDQILKLHKIAFISEKNLNEHLLNILRLKKIEKFMRVKKVYNDLTDEELDSIQIYLDEQKISVEN